MTDRVTTRERGTIPGCRPAGPDIHMAVDSKSGRAWVDIAREHDAKDELEKRR
jgi:hypothetical protein